MILKWVWWYLYEVYNDINMMYTVNTVKIVKIKTYLGTCLNLFCLIVFLFRWGDSGCGRS